MVYFPLKRWCLADGSFCLCLPAANFHAKRVKFCNSLSHKNAEILFSIKLICALLFTHLLIYRIIRRIVGPYFHVCSLFLATAEGTKHKHMGTSNPYFTYLTRSKHEKTHQNKGLSGRCGQTIYNVCLPHFQPLNVQNYMVNKTHKKISIHGSYIIDIPLIWWHYPLKRKFICKGVGDKAGSNLCP